MYHSRWTKSHYLAGFNFGNRLYKNNVKIDFDKFLNEEKIDYAKNVFSIYYKFYPEIIKEIRGFADGQKEEFEKVFAFLAVMYVFIYDVKCSMVAISNSQNIIFARNSDFKVEVKNLSDSTFYKLDKGYSFIANTTAMIEMEDGMNEKGLACGLTFVYPTIKDLGFNAGFLIRYILEKCETVDEVNEFLQKILIGSSQNLIAIDRYGKILSAELNSECKNISICKTHNYKTNHFVTNKLQKYAYDGIDDIFSHKRYETLQNQNYEIYTLKDTFELLQGKKGFLCQYDRKNGFDTIWSSVYDIKAKAIYRCEGNPQRKKYKIDNRLKFDY
ncbi:choloylglycine hydrolase family protein [Campylobacter blaseri]|uniref:Choloylglycine hydrolase n=1 Tax=Campylobacter blaseri TaxID=2042961 RepID=A0A2P8QZ24_9BACT|nr:C45 family autoproteolytic acyltransferase/hydolase [Campylobacter blaseri]PSM51495.1 choloylglycine hydrolase [Campylobacter blaseri]PSM52944.1 choloylglycine hydrolase [Campylobacter blaseri]QKF86495.1 choloylglycine hydrolase family protein [Campylobacter blaseri]